MAENKGVSQKENRKLNMQNAKYHTLDVKNVCERKLEIVFKKGKEFNGWFWLNRKRKKRITIPKGRKPIPPKTYKSMAVQLGLNTDQLDELLECPLTRDRYEEILSES